MLYWGEWVYCKGSCTCNEISFIHVHIHVIATCKAQLQRCFKLECKLFTVYVAIFFPVPIPLEPCVSQYDKAVGDHCCPKYLTPTLSDSLCYKQPSALRSKQYRLNPDVIGLNVLFISDDVNSPTRPCRMQCENWMPLCTAYREAGARRGVYFNPECPHSVLPTVWVWTRE